MSRTVFDYDRPDRFVVGTVGLPGERTFYLQARLPFRQPQVLFRLFSQHLLSFYFGRNDAAVKKIDRCQDPRLPNLFPVTEYPLGAVPVIAYERNGRISLPLCSADPQFPLFNPLQGGNHVGTRLDELVSIDFSDFFVGVKTSCHILDRIAADAH